MSYEAWRISYQDSEQAARAAYNELEKLRKSLSVDHSSEMHMELSWTTNKPATPGAYWVRGYHMGRPDYKALVEITADGDDLFCNLHNSNSDNHGDTDYLSDYSEEFEWCGPLMPSNTKKQEADKPPKTQKRTGTTGVGMVFGTCWG